MIGAMAGFAMASRDRPDGDLQGGPEHHSAAVRRRRPRRRLAAAAASRGGAAALDCRLGGHHRSADSDFYTGKIAAARWFAAQVLPHADRRAAIVEASDNALMDLPESAF